MLMLVAAAAAALPIADWQPTRTEGARMSVVDCDRGKCLSVAEWRSGPYGPRYDFARKLPPAGATFRGWFRTRGLLPRQAAVTVRFYGGGAQLSGRTYRLPASQAWKRFEIPVWRPPAGSESVALGVGLADRTDGEVMYAGLELAPQKFAPALPSGEPALTRAAPPSSFAPGRYFRIERSGTTWWLVTPRGRPFFSVATDPRDASERTAQQLRRMGFNSLAGWHNLAAWSAVKNPLPGFRSFQTRTDDPPYDLVANREGKPPGDSSAAARARGGFNHALPDPWDPRWEEWYRGQVRAQVQYVRGKPDLIAWFADNERDHRDLHRYVYARNSALALRRFLQTRYTAIAALNKAWGAQFRSFDELMERKPDPMVRHGAMYRDYRAFARELLRRYNQTVLRVIHEEDPGRLVFTNRFTVDEGQDLLDNLDLYSGFDGVGFNIYPANLSAGLNESERATLELIHERTGKPVIIGEWSVPALDSGLYNNPRRLDWSYPQAVETQRQRAAQSARILADFYNEPFVVGAHWFIWSDFDSPVRQANRGLFKASGEPWTELQQALRNVIARMAKP